jgi:alkylation response protein AidB-like acyl-CoA dehydrogenase
VAMATTSSERGLSLRSPGRFMATAERHAEQYRARREALDPELRERLARAFIDAEAYRWFTFQCATAMAAGGTLGPEASLSKLFWSEMDLTMHEAALALLGSGAELAEDASDAIDHGAWMKGFQFALAGPIYAGTNEIQRNVVAERVLGLPRK